MLALVAAPVGLVVSMGWWRRNRRVPRQAIPAVAGGSPDSASAEQSSAPPPPTSDARRRARRLGVLGLIVGVSVVAVMVGIVGFDEVTAVLGSYRLPFLAAAVGLQGLALMAISQVYRAVYRLTRGNLARMDAFRIGLGAYACMQILPAGGVVGGAYAATQLARRGADQVAAATTVVIFGLASMGTLASLLTIATTISAIVTGSSGTYVAISLAMASLFIIGIVMVHLVLSRPSWRGWVGTQVAKLRWRGRAPFVSVVDGLESHRDLLRHPKALAPTVGWSALAWTCAISMFAVLVYAAGGASVTAILASFAVAHLINGLPITPGGVGLVELGMAGTLIALDTDPAVASVAVVSYRLVASWLPVVAAVSFSGIGLRNAMAAPEVAR